MYAAEYVYGTSHKLEGDCHTGLARSGIMGK